MSRASLVIDHGGSAVVDTGAIVVSDVDRRNGSSVRIEANGTIMGDIVTDIDSVVIIVSSVLKYS